jgi:hypothetical protein
MGALFTPKGFLTYGGAILLLVGLLGMFGILIGPTPADSIFGSAWYFDNAENIAHTALGVVGLLAAFVLPAGLQKTLVLLLGVVGIVVAVYNIFSTSLLGANLESPADLILHAVVGAWALYASMAKAKS